MINCICINYSECFIINADALVMSSFMKKASCVVPSLLCVKLGRDDKWGQYVYQKCHDYRRSSNFQQKTLVTTLGQQPDDDVWVLSSDIQVDASGSLIPIDQHRYYWDDEYAITI